MEPVREAGAWYLLKKKDASPERITPRPGSPSGAGGAIDQWGFHLLLHPHEWPLVCLDALVPHGHLLSKTPALRAFSSCGSVRRVAWNPDRPSLHANFAQPRLFPTLTRPFSESPHPGAAHHQGGLLRVQGILCRVGNQMAEPTQGGTTVACCISHPITPRCRQLLAE